MKARNPIARQRAREPRQFVSLRLAAFTAVMMLVSVAFASQTHWLAGSGAQHLTTPHNTYNPSDLWVKMRPPGTGNITSGGRYHDNCSGNQCYPAFSGSDWALDIGASGTTAAKLYLDYGGFESTFNGVPVDNNQTIRIRAQVIDEGNWRDAEGADPACDWQQLAVLATWTGTNGTEYTAKTIGKLYFGHLTSWNYDVGDFIFTNHSYTNPNGSGTVQFVNGVTIGTVYNGAGTVLRNNHVCSSGAHIHSEGYSYHDWGKLPEWHSQSGPDSYVQETNPANNHIHNGIGTYGGGDTADSVTQGGGANDRILAYFGGDSTSFRMINNPASATHGVGHRDRQPAPQ